VFLSPLGPLPHLAAGEGAAAVEKRLAEMTGYLASDELEGRGPGTHGLDLAAEYIALQFRKCGLKTDCFTGTPFQTVPGTSRPRMGSNNRLAFVGPAKDAATPERIELKLGEDFNPLAISGSGKIDVPAVFAGYGITGKEEHYDDYTGLDAAGKAVVVLRQEPQQADSKSVFRGTEYTEHATFARKVANARDHKAAAIVLVNDDFTLRTDVVRARQMWQDTLDRLGGEHTAFKKIADPMFDQIEKQRKRIEELVGQVGYWGGQMRQALGDPVLSFQQVARGPADFKLPVIFCRRAVVDRVLRAAARTDLATLERQIDNGPTPHSLPLPGWRVTGEIEVERYDGRNVLAVREGAGTLAEETIVIGAHYDHLGYVATNSQPPKLIYHGADDNASGTAVMLEVARNLAKLDRTPRRRLVFVAFAGEELGVLGSKWYVDHPAFSLEKTVTMINVDMVGRMRENGLEVHGVGTSKHLESLVDQLSSRARVALTKVPRAGPSDDIRFSQRRIPSLHFFTGIHVDYHKATDRADKLDLAGMRRITAMVTDLAEVLATDPMRPKYDEL
jgi:hypothetical protein